MSKNDGTIINTLLYLIFLLKDEIHYINWRKAYNSLGDIEVAKLPADMYWQLAELVANANVKCSNILDSDDSLVSLRKERIENEQSDLKQLINYAQEECDKTGNAVDKNLKLCALFIYKNKFRKTDEDKKIISQYTSFVVRDESCVYKDVLIEDPTNKNHYISQEEFLNKRLHKVDIRKGRDEILLWL